MSFVQLLSSSSAPSRHARPDEWGCGQPGYQLGYYGVCCLAYTVGLAITLAANTFGWTFNGVQGQPALLYLVPCTVGAVAARGVLRKEFRQLWRGTLLTPPPPAELAAGARDMSARHERAT